MGRLIQRSLTAAALVLAALVIGRLPAYAAGTVGDGTPASCTSNAVQAALNGGGTVDFDCGPTATTIVADTYVINQDTIVDGGGLITLDGENLRQIFLVQANATLELRNLFVKDGNFSNGGCVSVASNATLKIVDTRFSSCESPTDGGAIYSLGTLIVDYGQFTDNVATDDGGAIFAQGAVTVRDSLFSTNLAESGGGIRLNAGTLALERSLFNNNRATGNGGAIDITTGTATITNSTFYLNRADTGGGIYSAGGSTDTAVKASTLFGNRANTGGAIYYFGNGAFTLQSSIASSSLDLAGTSPALECDGPSITSQGYNLIGDGSCFSGEPTDTKNVDTSGGVKLGALTTNGGFTQTLLPAADSPAVDRIPQATCTAVDQRRALRIAPCDIGATERGALLPSLYLPIALKSS